jgi:hypothetical protein
MRSRIIMTAICTLMTSTAVAQQRWSRTYGGASDEYGYSIDQTQDGGYIATGRSASFGNLVQVYLIKIDASGDTIWTRTYGGADDEYGRSVQQTSDGGYIIAGWTFSFGNAQQAYLIKTNASGDTIWTRTYGGAGDDGGGAVQQTSDGGYVVAGWTGSFGNGDQVYLIKTNASGDTLWTRSYGGAGDDIALSVQQTSDTGYIVAGYATSFGDSSQVYLIKTNPSGDTLWTRSYGGAGDDGSRSVQQTFDGGYIVAGYTTPPGDSSQAYLIKTNASGDTLWARTYWGSNGGAGSSVQQTSDTGYIVAGETYTTGRGLQVYLIRTNAAGDCLWTRDYGGASGDFGYSVHQTSDGGYIVAGRTASFGNQYQVYLIKTDANGSTGVEETPNSEVRTTNVPAIVRGVLFLPCSQPLARHSLLSSDGRTALELRGGANDLNDLAPGIYFVIEGGSEKTVRVRKVILTR